MRDVETIYNTYLRIQRSKKGLPFKLRKDFSGIQNDEMYPVLLKLENFFKRNSYVNLNDFFEAPYEIYKDENHFNLNFYITQKAIKVYSLYQKKKTYMDPDSDLQRKFATEGLGNIYDFCKQNNLKLDEYVYHKTNNLNTVFIHLKEKKISIYNCLMMKDFQKVVNENNYELLEFMLGDIISRLSIFRTKLYSSKRCKKICEGGLKILKERLEKFEKRDNITI
jgi:hypothetical protein